MRNAVDCRSNSSPAQSPTRGDGNPVTWDFGDSSEEENLRRGREEGLKIHGLGGANGTSDRESGFQRSGSSISFANEDEASRNRTRLKPRVTQVEPSLFPLSQIVEFMPKVTVMSDNAHDDGNVVGGGRGRRPRRQHRRNIPPPTRGESERALTRRLSKSSIDWDFDSPPRAQSPVSVVSPTAVAKRGQRGSGNDRSR